MEEYHTLVQSVLRDGNYKPNRTQVDTISSFMQSYSLDLQKGFPLLTTKNMGGYRWNSMIHELLWFLSGEHHIRNLREETSIWDDWANEDGTLPTAYGRFWRRYPIPNQRSRLQGEWWPDSDAEWISAAATYYDVSEGEIRDAIDRWVSGQSGGMVFDQIKYVIDTLNGDHPYRGPESRRIIVDAWHPPNAAVSKLPPCHYTYIFNVQGGKVNVHLLQRSGDIALGIPFNIAQYCLLAKIIVQQTDLELGQFGHTIVDSHIYCGKGSRGEWYGENLPEVQEWIAGVSDIEEFQEVGERIEEEAPDEDKEGFDHVPRLLKQLSRRPYDWPEVTVAEKPLDEITHEDITLINYESHPGIDFKVAE